MATMSATRTSMSSFRKVNTLRRFGWIHRSAAVAIGFAMLVLGGCTAPSRPKSHPNSLPVSSGASSPAPTKYELVPGKVALYIDGAPTQVRAFTIPDASNGWLTGYLESDRIDPQIANGGVACAGQTVEVGETRISRTVPTGYQSCSQNRATPATVQTPYCLGAQHNQMPPLPAGKYRIVLDTTSVPDAVFPRPVTVRLTAS